VSGAVAEARRRHLAVARLLSSSVVSQAVLSAASFAIGLLLIRHAAAVEYGAFILASNAIALLASLQNAFFGPLLASRLQRLDRAGRAALVGGLYRAQRRMLAAVLAVAALAAGTLWAAGRLDARTAVLAGAAAGAACAVLNRDYFRMVLLAHRRANEVLQVDLLYAMLVVAGVVVAARTGGPATVALLAMGAAALPAAMLLARAVRSHEPWQSEGSAGLLRQVAPLAAWSCAGAAIHWAFSQGTVYLVAGTLDVAAVAAMAATRLLLMPVNLLSTGIGSLMLPLASGWLHRHGEALVLRRLALFALGLGAITLGYVALLWGLRDWIFQVVFRKDFEQRDALLLLWGGVFLVLVVRDQLAYLLAAQGRFRELSTLTLLSASASLAASYLGMLRFGVAGAVLGMLVGELISLAGVVALSWRGRAARLAMAA